MIALLLGWTAARAAVPVGPGVQVLLRVLSYDRALPGRVESPLDVRVVHVGDDALSTEQAREVERAFSQPGLSVLGIPVVTRGAVDARDGLTEEMLAGADVVVLCRGTEAVAGAAAAWGAAEDVPVLTFDAGLAGKGPAVGLTVAGARLGMVVDLAAAHAQGLDLSPEVLQLATVVNRN